MTVCVAAISDNAWIIAASDRMLTSGDVQFQPPQRKVFHINDSIIGLVAGDFALQTELFLMVYGAIAKAQKQQKDQNTPATVKWIADCYAWAYENVHRKRGSQMILAPLGLTTETFLTKQKDMAPSLVEKLTNQLIKFDLPETETIICGIDQFGPHIYVAEDGAVRCEDSVGFAAIGAGYWHAQSQLMFAGYTRLTPMSKALYQVYAAKKRAETAPGVGTFTDMHYIGPNYISVRDDLVESIDQAYQRVRDGTEALRASAETEVDSYVKKIVAAAPAPSPVNEAEKKTPEIEFRPTGNDAPVGGADAAPPKKPTRKKKRR